MIRLLTDVNVNGDIVRGLRIQKPEFDVVLAQDLGLDGVPDDLVLETAAAYDRILLTNDRRTIKPLVRDRLAQGLPMSGVFLMRPRHTVRSIIDELLMIDACSEHQEWSGRIEFIPY